MTLTHLGVI